MKCPTDGATLLMAERRGVPIDYCPECRGVWLEHGRLDRLLDQDDRGHGGRHEDDRHHDAHADSEHHDKNQHGDGRRRKGGVGAMLGDLLGGGGD